MVASGQRTAVITTGLLPADVIGTNPLMTPRPSVLAASTLLALAIALTTASEARAQTIGAPVLNNNQPILNTGNTVTLALTAPTFGTAIGYVIEAASVPGGAPDLVNYYTGNPATSLLVPGVPPGVY